MLPGNTTNSELSTAERELARRIGRVMQKLRAANPWPPAQFSEGGCFRIPISIGGEPHMMPLGFVGSRGCNWARAGGCTMCDYGGFEGHVPDSVLVGQAAFLLGEWSDEREINLSSLGSFFDENELSENARNGILRLIGANGHIELLGVESRAQDITEEKIRSARRLLGAHRCLEVGIGLESIDPFVRNVCVNKGLSLETFERAVGAVQSAGAHAVGHVLLKPPFLTESEAVMDAVASIEYLDSLSFRRIVMMATNVKRGTIVGELYRLGLYRPPWLWSVLKVALSVSAAARGKLLLYGFRCGLPLEAISHNCRHCSDIVLRHIEGFCGTGDSRHLGAGFAIECSCKSKWEDEVAKQARTLLCSRVAEALGFLECTNRRVVHLDAPSITSGTPGDLVEYRNADIH